MGKIIFSAYTIQKSIPDGLKNYMWERNSKQLEESMFKYGQGKLSWAEKQWNKP